MIFSFIYNHQKSSLNNSKNIFNYFLRKKKKGLETTYYLQKKLNMLKRVIFFNFNRYFVTRSAYSLKEIQQQTTNKNKPTTETIAVNFNSVLKHEIKVSKLKKEDKKLMQTILLLRSKKKQKETEQIIIEGNQLIKEAVQANLKLNQLVFSNFSKIQDILEILGNSTSSIEFLKVPDSDLSFYSVLQTCPGCLAIFDKPKSISPKENALDISVIVDNCREPNNLGAMLRVSNSLPCLRVLLPKGNVDLWDTKTIRGSAGSVFHIPTQSQLSWTKIDEMIGRDDLVLIADNNINEYNSERILEYDKIPIDLLKTSSISIIIGGENRGIGEEAKEFAYSRNWRVINIPIDKTVNSLNISNALAIILFEIRRSLKS